MYRTFLILVVALLSCSPKIQQLSFEQIEEDRARFEEWLPYMKCFAQEDSLLQDDRPAIVFTGSSSIRMWETLQEDMAGLPYQILNRGFGGSTMLDVNYFFDDLLLRQQPEIVVLYCGENDVAGGQTARNVYESFHVFLQLMKQKLPETKLLYVSMKPSLQRQLSWPEFVRGNKLIADYIRQQENPNMAYVDVSETMFDAASGLPDSTIFLSDGLHMNSLGYDRWEAIIYEELKIILNVKDEEEQAYAAGLLDTIMNRAEIQATFLANTEKTLHTLAAERPAVDTAYWSAFFSERVRPNLEKVTMFVENQLVKEMTMAELELLACQWKAYADPIEREEDRAVQAFLLMQSQQLDKLDAFLTEAILNDLEAVSEN